MQRIEEVRCAKDRRGEARIGEARNIFLNQEKESMLYT